MGDEDGPQFSGADASTVTERLRPSQAGIPAVDVDLPVLREAFSVGTLVDGAYRILDVIGEGSMGIVLRAHDRRLDRDVALKTVRASMLERPDARERFVTEARAMARLHHPNVVAVHALGEWRGIPYIAMEHVPGMTLEEWVGLRGEEPRSIDETLGLLDQLCLGVEAIHASGVAHRDLKAANVLVAPGFRIVVADLGITRSLHGVTVSERTMSGTPLMMAPEIVLGLPLDARALVAADVYALGVLAYRALVGRYPFIGTEARDVLAAHVSEPVPPPSSVRPDLPKAFDAVLLQALAKDPARRTPSAAALREALHAARDSSKRATRPPRFLVADDDAEHCALVARILAQAFPGAVVEQVGDGLAALEAAERNPPTAIVTDLHMPRMNGLELLGTLRATPRLARIPVVVVTGMGNANDWKALARMGADSCLVKPFDALQVAVLLRALIERPRGVKET